MNSKLKHFLKYLLLVIKLAVGMSFVPTNVRDNMGLWFYFALGIIFGIAYELIK